MRWAFAFDDSPTGLRRLALLLYAIVGPVFTAVMLVLRDRSGPLWPVVGVVVLILAGAAVLLLQPAPSTAGWIFVAAVSPTLCCGLAVVAGGPLGTVYLGVMGAPLAWAAILYDWPVAIGAFLTATATCFAVLLRREDLLDATASTAVFSTINGLVGWVVYGMARHLRATKALLRASGERDRALLEAIPDTLVRADRQGRFIDLHAPPGDALPLQPEELIGRTVFELLPPDVVPRMRAAIERVFASRSLEVIEYEAPYGAARRTFESRLAYASPDEILVIRRDITQQRRSEEQLRLSSAMTEHMQEAVISVGSDLRVRSWAGAAEPIYGWTAAEAVGRPLASLVQPELAPADAERLAARLAAQGAQRTVVAQRRKDGSRIVVDASTAVLRGLDGSVTGYLAVVRDVTEQKQAERNLRRSEERLRLALGAGAHIVWDWDLGRDAFTHGPAWPELLGRPAGEVPDTIDGWRSVVHPDDLGRAWEALQECVSGRAEEYNAQYRIRRASGEWRWIRSQGRATRRDASGRALRMVGTRTDITETEELNRRLLQATRLASVGTLAAGVAHEINNPLAYVRANLDLCRELIATSPELAAGKASAELQQLLGEACEGADRIGQIVRSMRSLGRPEAPDVVSEIDLGDELRSAIQLARNLLVQRARLTVEVPAALPTVRAMTNELGRVFLNLLMNAAQAIPEGAAEGNEITVSARAAGPEVVVEVADTGCGLTAEARTRMFDAFFTTKPVGQGTGLGLTIARSIVDAAGGRIEVAGRDGRGTRFLVHLPVSGGRAPPVAPTPPRQAVQPRHRVLLIDDDPTVRRSFERLIARHHDVLGVESAEDALRRISGGERWDAILCDLMMSGMDGMRFYERLSASHPSMLPHLAFITGGAFGDRATRFLADHPVLVIPKPADADELLGAIQQLATQETGQVGP